MKILHHHGQRLAALEQSMQELRSDFERRSRDLQTQLDGLAETVHRQSLENGERSKRFEVWMCTSAPPRPVLLAKMDENCTFLQRFEAK